LKWFKHDSNASVDAKLERLMLKHGMEGYGLYWFCLETIARTVEKHNLTFELEHDAEIIAHRVGMHPEKVQDIMTDMVNFGLFENDRGVITCLKMAARTDEYTQKLIRDSGIVPTISRQSPDNVRVNRIEENRTEKKRNTFKPPTLEEVREFCKERGNSVDPETFLDHYEANGWYRGKTKIKDWKACVRTWEKNSVKSENEFEGAI
jgi:hypothetical protein